MRVLSFLFYWLWNGKHPHRFFLRVLRFGLGKRGLREPVEARNPGAGTCTTSAGRPKPSKAGGRTSDRTRDGAAAAAVTPRFRRGERQAPDVRNRARPEAARQIGLATERRQRRSRRASDAGSSESGIAAEARRRRAGFVPVERRNLCRFKLSYFSLFTHSRAHAKKGFFWLQFRLFLNMTNSPSFTVVDVGV
jgi:hypothetical protein